jgi:hypothetical protein
LEGYNHE